MRTIHRMALALAAGVLLFADLTAGVADAQFFRRRGRERFPNPYTPYPVPYPFGDGTYSYNPSLFYNRGYYGYVPPVYPGAYNPPVITSALGSESFSPYYPVRGVGTGEIEVLLPSGAENAQLKVNGVELGTSTGYHRNLYVSDVTPGYGHAYTIAATWTQDGNPVTEVRHVRLDGFGKATANFLIPEERENVTAPALRPAELRSPGPPSIDRPADK